MVTASWPPSRLVSPHNHYSPKDCPNGSARTDVGVVINPKLVEAQVQGCIGQGLMQAFKGKITFEKGTVQQSNFHDYRLITLAEMPEIVVTLLESDAPPSGIGEIGVAPVAPAVANAIFAITGIRLRKMPFEDEGFTLGNRVAD